MCYQCIVSTVVFFRVILWYAIKLYYYYDMQFYPFITYLLLKNKNYLKTYAMIRMSISVMIDGCSYLNYRLHDVLILFLTKIMTFIFLTSIIKNGYIFSGCNNYEIKLNKTLAHYNNNNTTLFLYSSCVTILLSK